jgi:hypothetical protein
MIAKRGLPNQHGRLSRDASFQIRLAAGACPSCAMFEPGWAKLGSCSGNSPGVIYRRSAHSVTFRCNRCKLQWTITLANLHRCAAAKAITPGESEMPWYQFIADETAFAVECEAKRKSTISRQTNRRVWRLGNGEAPMNNQGTRAVQR